MKKMKTEDLKASENGDEGKRYFVERGCNVEKKMERIKGIKKSERQKKEGKI